jgi:hypothetical protein
VTDRFWDGLSSDWYVDKVVIKVIKVSKRFYLRHKWKCLVGPFVTDLKAQVCLDDRRRQRGDYLHADLQCAMQTSGEEEGIAFRRRMVDVVQHLNVAPFEPPLRTRLNKTCKWASGWIIIEHGIIVIA